jgi:hypothetical protein
MSIGVSSQLRTLLGPDPLTKYDLFAPLRRWKADEEFQVLAFAVLRSLP